VSETKKIVVPRDMEVAALESISAHAAHPRTVHTILEAALRQLSNVGVVPTSEQLEEFTAWPAVQRLAFKDFTRWWQRRMFLAEPEIPEAVKDLMWDKATSTTIYDPRVIEAFERGMASIVRVELDRENDGRWIADIPSLPGCMAYGASKEQAKENALSLAVKRLAGREE
jgi:hypothetical protein